MEKKWPSYIAIAIICIPLFVVLGFAEKLSMALFLSIMSVLTVIVPMALAWIIGYMGDVKRFAENFKDSEMGKKLTYKENFAIRRALWNPVIVGVLCGASLLFTDAICAVITIILIVIVAFKVKAFVGEYKEMKEFIKDSTDSQRDAE